MKENTRRSFIKKTAAGAVMAAGLSHVLSQAVAKHTPKVKLRKDDIILFQGDSITDAGRNRDQKGANNSRGLGGGYAFMSTAKLLREHPDKALQLYNRGISGNKVYQLAERWDEDCLQLKPTVLSILIGVNDFWHMLNGEYDGTVDTYRNDYEALLQRTRNALPDVKLIIGEPFAIPGVKAVDSTWFPRFSAYQEAARALADKFDATFIPYQSLFEKASREAPAAYWTYDGVHPSLAGNELMAETWVAIVE